jgi:cytochrome b
MKSDNSKPGLTVDPLVGIKKRHAASATDSGVSRHQSLYVWDLPTRLFHWLLALLVATSFYTGLTGGFDIMDYHMLSGYGILTLVLFRCIWGFVGNEYARFRQFLAGPRRVIRYVKANLGRPSDPTPAVPAVGHNPLGGWSVMAMLGALLTQAGTGLFANDDIFTEGPLVHLVSGRLSSQLTGVHETMAWIIGGLILLHLAAIAFYQLRFAENLWLPMIKGRRPLTSAEHAPMTDASNPWIRGLVLVTITATGVFYLVRYV